MEDTCPICELIMRSVSVAETLTRPVMTCETMCLSLVMVTGAKCILFFILTFIGSTGESSDRKSTTHDHRLVMHMDFVFQTSKPYVIFMQEKKKQDRTCMGTKSAVMRLMLSSLLRPHTDSPAAGTSL